MAQMVFRITGLAVAKNIRGVEMRRLTLHAVEGDAFKPTEGASAEPEGFCEMLVSAEYIREKKLNLGDTVTMDLREQ
jgi:hypothetical protein